MWMKPDLFGWKEIAALLERSVDTARRYAREGDLPVRRVRGRIEARRDELLEWWRAQSERAA